MLEFSSNGVNYTVSVLTYLLKLRSYGCVNLCDGRPGTEAAVSSWFVLGTRCCTDIAECHPHVCGQRTWPQVAMATFSRSCSIFITFRRYMNLYFLSGSPVAFRTKTATCACDHFVHSARRYDTIRCKIYERALNSWWIASQLHIPQGTTNRN